MKFRIKANGFFESNSMRLNLLTRIYMKTRFSYTQNKPLYHSIAFGVLYFIFCWSIQINESLKLMFLYIMLLLPGITFPLSTCYYTSIFEKHISLRRVIHFVLSVGIYYTCVCLYTDEVAYKLIDTLGCIPNCRFS
jgi:hypothetical protein